jgi:type IV secretion system protein VirB10
MTTNDPNQSNPTGHQDHDLHDDHGLPSVNRRAGSNKLITILGTIFLLLAGIALIVAVNSGEKGKPAKKNQVADRVESNLPKLIIPATPPPPTPPPVTVQPANQAAVSATGPQPPPIPLKPAPAQPPKPPANANAKPPMTWQERKMTGIILVDDKGGSNGTAPAKVEGVQEPHERAGERGELATKLEATVTKMAAASLLPNRNFIIAKGTTLDCALETALNTTVPGLTRCRLTSDVYSDDGKVVLLDRGSQMVGEYAGGIKQGQARIFVLWTRAKTPNGVVVNLNSPGTDALGRGGLEGWVDNHFIERFGAAIMITLLQDAVAVIIANQQNKNTGNGSNSTIMYGQNSLRGNEKFIEKTLDAQLNIPPTLYKNQGDHIQIMVARDLDFSGVYALKVLE